MMAPGTRVGPYEITAALGAGGMGEVYRARDARLNRDVAIKILPAAFANDPTRMARFEREAQVLAALNHPNIAAIYGVEEGALVMELVEGQTLAERIARGAIPLDETLALARQIGDGLEAAHEKAIIHRDLKPANIKITPEGKVKILDFGLAAVAQASGPVSGDPSNSPTLTLEATRTGMILGTAGYMAPEQARGRPVDKRADIWALGVILYEMLTGKELFQGETISDTLAAVLAREPDVGRVPEKVRRLLRRCLEKDPKKRLRDIGEAWAWLEEEPAGTVPLVKSSKVSWALAGVFAIATLVLAFVLYRRPAEESRPIQFTIQGPETTTPQNPAISPDGRRIAFVVGGRSEIWVHDLESFTARRLAGTEGARWPFWSADSRHIAFFAGNNKLKRIGMAGGPVQSLADTDPPTGGSWGKNDVIVFGNSSGLWRVPASGGTATPLTEPNPSSGEVAHRFPCFLSDGRHFLYSAGNVEPEKTSLYVADLDSKKRHLVMTSNISNALYAQGYLLFVRDQTLMAQPFDAGKLKISGDPLPVAEPVTMNPALRRGGFSISQNGVLLYHSASPPQEQLTWYDRSGTVIGTIGQPGLMRSARISPDGNTVAFDWRDEKTGSFDVWLHDLTRDTTSKFTLDSTMNQIRCPIWSPDGSSIAFLSTKDGVPRLYQKPVNGSGQDTILDPTESGECATEWSSDGRYIIEQNAPGTQSWERPVGVAAFRCPEAIPVSPN